ncbi:MAG: HD domain-containing protein [Gammaproteobacteria bacterium]|nr:HD domain-containing protein [Gammaproteobacteria bacterium]
MDAKSSQSIISAALTSNIAILNLQDILQQQSSALSEEQQKEVRSHPEKGVAMLKACGINDPEWLDSVRQHHERANGKGYPGGLTGDKTVIGAKILALADVYSAMISPRVYRKSLEASGALKTVFLERGKEYDETLSILLIKRMGIYPPGSYVRLRNEEIAIVTKRSYDSMKPGVASLVNPNGKSYIKPLYRNTQSPEYSILGAVEFNGELEMALPLIWGYG